MYGYFYLAIGKYNQEENDPEPSGSPHKYPYMEEFCEKGSRYNNILRFNSFKLWKKACNLRNASIQVSFFNLNNAFMTLLNSTNI